jgi:hypothetical protein
MISLLEFSEERFFEPAGITVYERKRGCRAVILSYFANDK